MKIKKIIAFLLAGSMLFAVGCSTSGNDSSADESAHSNTDSEESRPFVDVEKLRAEFDGLYNDSAAVRDGIIKNHAVGKAYTVSVKASDDYPDPDSNKLTDGVFAHTTFSGGNKKDWVGYKPGGATVTIELNLGKVFSDLSEIGINLCKDMSSGIGLPGSVNIYIARGDEDYKLLGTVSSPAGGADSMIYKAVLLPKNTVDASKIKFEIKNPASTWLFIDELIVANYEKDETPQGDYYGDFDVPEIKTPVLWNSGEADFKDKINLARGKSYQIRSGLPLDNAKKIPSQNSTENSPLLTDGKRTSEMSYSGPAWFHFTGGNDREIVIDLEKTGAVTGFSVGFLRDKSAGVSPPSSLEVFVSEDGRGWQKVFEQKQITTQKEKDIARIEQSIGKIRARFFKLSFSVSPHVWVDEIEVMGTKDLTGAAAVVPDTNIENKYPNRYASPADFDGMKDVFLSYTAPGGTPITKEIYLPHVAYIVKNEIKDTLFDSFLFLPNVNFLYDDYDKKALKKSDWQAYIDNNFLQDSNMNALEAAVGEVKTALGDADYKVSVFMSILYPVIKQTAFGEIGGKNLNFNNIDDRKAAIKWLIDEQLSRFNENNYQNLYLKGFYWFTEEIDYNDPHIIELVRFTTDYVRSLGFITSWIPYHQASGYANWKELGFDITCYQPNYAFDHTIPISRIYESAEMAKKLGMCIELEVGSASAADVARLKAYYYVGSQLGFMNDAIHMYYQGGVPGVIYAAYKSNDPFVHSLYEDTYLFIKGKFAPKIKQFDHITIEGKDKAAGQIDISNNPYAVGLVLTESPRYGAVKFKANGVIEYTPYNKITGEDSFTLFVDYSFAQSEPITITVRINDN